MPIEPSRLIAGLEPEKTVLLFGAGSSVPSGAPSVERLKAHFETKFSVSANSYSLAEQTGIIEHETKDRRRLIEELRTQFVGLRPTGAILNLPLYDWKSIFTTNYDNLIEDSYQRRKRPFSAYSSNFDFGVRSDPDAIKIFKLHGTIDKDSSDGSHSRIILTENDYDVTSQYREQLYDRLKADIGGSHLIIIGHSLADPDVKAVVDRALALNQTAGGGGKITLFVYTRDDGRAGLLESRGISVCFGGLDDFFAGLAGRIAPKPPTAPASGDPLDLLPGLRPSTIDVAHAADSVGPNISGMYNGWPATYADIKGDLTFRRNIADTIVEQLTTTSKYVSTILGASGVGKTTAARQALFTLSGRGLFCWEHKIDQPLIAHYWRSLAKDLAAVGAVGCLLIDDAHAELSELNDLVDYLTTDGNISLKIICVSSANQWRPRIKSPGLHKSGLEYSMVHVQGDEIDRLLNLIEAVPSVRALIEDNFAGFSRSERRRRLTQRCEADMFVCLKNIFSSEKFDDIILREYATLDPTSQDIYRVVAAMESAGVRVHRQLIIRLLGISADDISAILTRLTDIIHEQTVNEREGIYAWRGRHTVIMQIIAEHKYYTSEKRFDLFARVIDAISPTYDIEIRTIRELCNVDTGLATIPDKKDQNILLRKMLSVAPRERVPRHRLIRNLISLGDYDQAETEIRLFEKDFRVDGPAARYKIDLAVARAVRSPGLMAEDRVVLLEKARESAVSAASRFRYNKAVLSAYCELGLELARLTMDTSTFDSAISELKLAENHSADPDISRRIARFESRIGSIISDGEVEYSVAEIED